MQHLLRTLLHNTSEDREDRDRNRLRFLPTLGHKRLDQKPWFRGTGIPNYSDTLVINNFAFKKCFGPCLREDSLERTCVHDDGKLHF